MKYRLALRNRIPDVIERHLARDGALASDSLYFGLENALSVPFPRVARSPNEPFEDISLQNLGALCQEGETVEESLR